MIAILADDLTGALDSAAPFAGRGMRTEVALELDVIAEILDDRPDVIAINLGCRELDAPAARAATARVMSQLPPGITLFKKVDSRLKGNIAAELDAISFDRALVAPAIPDFGRIVEAECVQGFGIDVPIPIGERLGPYRLRAVIPDCRSVDDIDAALSAAEADGTDLLIGARGLADALARRMTGRVQAQPAELQAGPAIFVIGSRDPITLAQVTTLKTAHAVRYLPAPNGKLTMPAADGSPLTLVQATQAAETSEPQQVSDALAASFGRNAGTTGTLVLSGGATAEAVLRTLHISRLRLLGECLPGLGLAYVGGRCIVAKSGGFGKPDTLKDLAEMILRKAG